MRIIIPFFFFSILFLTSCGPSAEEMAAREKCRQEQLEIESAIRQNLKNTFNAPFPKRNRNLTRILGDTLRIEGKCFPLSYQIISTRKYNLIIDMETGDTLFKGTVCKYRDLYYFNEKLNDTSYRIFALKITDSLIYGLQNYFQYHQIDSIIEKGTYPNLVKFMDKSKKAIRLQPQKKELRKLYSSILEKTKPFEIIRTKIFPSNDLEEIDNEIEKDDYEYISKVYPNPARDYVNF
jgi:hypothetical protein